MSIAVGIHQVVIDTSNTANFVIAEAVDNQYVRLLAMKLSSGSANADIIIRDTDGTNIGGKHALGGAARTSQDWQHNPAGWCESGDGKGLVLFNEDSAVITGVAVIEVRYAKRTN